MSTDQEWEFIYGLLKLQRPTHIVEIGVASGGMACSIVNAMHENIKTTNKQAWYTGYDLWDIHGATAQFAQLGSLELVSESLNKINKENWNLVKQDTQNNQSKFRYDLKHRFTNGIDFAFIDGCHSYQGITNDFFNVWPHMNPQGIIAFHDTAVIDGCREFIADLRIHNNGSYDISDYPYGTNERNCGITLITTPGFGDVKIDEICTSISTPSEIYEKENNPLTPTSQWWLDNLKERI